MAPEPTSVPFNPQHLTGRELHHLAAAVLGRHLAGDGPFTRRCQAWLERWSGAHRVLLTSSDEAALDLAALLCGVGPDDEVIVPAFAFFPVANAFLLRGARVVFADVRPDTLTLDEEQAAAAVGERTRALVPVSYAGCASDLEALCNLARRRGLRLIEEASQGFGSAWRGRPLGSWGDLGIWSFHATRALSCGEGGALVIGDQSLAERAEVLRERGSTRARLLRRETDRYAWVEAGPAALPSELAAAVLWAQLESAEPLLARRRAACELYRRELAGVAEAAGARLPALPADTLHNGAAFHLLLPGAAERQALLARLAAAGIAATSHYEPLHLEPVGRSLGYRPGDFPVAEAASRRLVRLPCHADLTPRQQEAVVREVRAFFEAG